MAKFEKLTKPEGSTVTVTHYGCGWCGAVHARKDYADRCCMCGECGEEVAVVDNNGKPLASQKDRWGGKMCWRCYRKKEMSSLRGYISRGKERALELRQQALKQDQSVIEYEQRLEALKIAQPPAPPPRKYEPLLSEKEAV